MNKENIVSKVWSFCDVLRDDGVSYTDYIEQITFLLFLKMADEYSKPPYNRSINIPKKYTWEKTCKAQRKRAWRSLFWNIEKIGKSSRNDRANFCKSLKIKLKTLQNCQNLSPWLTEKIGSSWELILKVIFTRGF